MRRDKVSHLLGFFIFGHFQMLLDELRHELLGTILPLLESIFGGRDLERPRNDNDPFNFQSLTLMSKTWSSLSLFTKVTQTTAALIPARWVREANTVDSISILATP